MDLDAVTKHVCQLPACNGKVVVCGFCWGGGQAFHFATHNKDIKAAFVFYGTGPMKEEEVARISCPVYGFYGENDARVNATIPQSKELMKKAGKKYEPVKYTGAGHGFMRAGEAPGRQRRQQEGPRGCLETLERAVEANLIRLATPTSRKRKRRSFVRRLRFRLVGVANRST